MSGRGEHRGSSSSDSQVSGGGGSCETRLLKTGLEITKLGISDEIVFALARHGITELFPIQVAKSFREFKHRLRVKYYDKYDNGVDRKRNCPQQSEIGRMGKIKWIMNLNLRENSCGQRARRLEKAVKALHTSVEGERQGPVHDMKSKNPNVKVTRTDSYMAIHTHKDGSFIAPERMERIKAIIEDDPASVSLDLDHDPVAQVCGPDKFGRVLGMSVGISKTSLASSAPAKEQLCQQKQQHSMLEERFGSLGDKWSPSLRSCRDKRRSGGQQSHRRIVADSSATSNV
ncbi:hypothetical protein IFM89_010830 [Coptis chinensis]|uniref:Uncharacterized protein n=1 Tax=Coptis chinensis TaxID=261450 RepID=A0A835I3Z0_9MAGN|nr:hypothetical protein IFM89_010830 [Coptis chinensis]